MNRKDIETLVEQKVEKQKPLAKIEQVTENKIIINSHDYLIVFNPSDSFDLNDFKRQYNAALSNYDYIVGDISFNQLRLKGFYADTKNNVSDNMKISSLQDYLMEYCNFGVKYYVLCNLEVNKKHITNHRRRKKYQNGKRFKIKGKQHAYIKQKIVKRRSPINKRKNIVVTKSKGKGNRHFTIRQKKNWK